MKGLYLTLCFQLSLSHCLPHLEEKSLPEHGWEPAARTEFATPLSLRTFSYCYNVPRFKPPSWAQCLPGPCEVVKLHSASAASPRSSVVHLYQPSIMQISTFLVNMKTEPRAVHCSRRRRQNHTDRLQCSQSGKKGEQWNYYDLF